MRGENSCRLAFIGQFDGTSPRAWGKLFVREAPIFVIRNIPTCVGKTDRRLSRLPFRTEHPHVRGENPDSDLPEWTATGTSPRAWGKLHRIEQICARRRNIPTCVGKTRVVPMHKRDKPEHPHVRGENLLPAESAHRADGTSPRAWGKQISAAIARTAHRNIPTCVGKTCCQPNPRTAQTEHPHVRGENSRLDFAAISAAGTSPRAWGKHVRDLSYIVEERNIPTCVGKTLKFHRISK